MRRINLKLDSKIIVLSLLLFLLFSCITTAEDKGKDVHSLSIGMIEALENGEDIEVIKEYLSKGADPNYNIVYGPPLKSAAQGNVSLEVVKLLLESGAEPEIQYFMLYECNFDMIRLLADNGADLNDSIDLTGIYDPLAIIDDKNIEAEVKEYNLQKELLYPLIDPEVIPELSKPHGIEAGVAGAGSKSLLTIAVEAGRVELVELLIELGSDVNVEEAGINFLLTPLVQACRNTEKPELVSILLRAGADPGLTNMTGHTALMVAASSGNLKACESLLIYGADINAQSAMSMSPLLGAVQGKNLELVSLLIDQGADLDMSYDYGMNILHLAAIYSTPEIVELLLESGIDPISTDYENRTPYQLALVNYNNKIVDKLKKYGGERIIAPLFSDYIKGKELKSSDSKFYKFYNNGAFILSIDKEGERDHIRVWRRYKNDYFLTKLDYMFKVPAGKSSYNIYNNLHLSVDGTMLIIYDQENRRIYLDGTSFSGYTFRNFEEAADADFVTLSLMFFAEDDQGIAAFYKRDNKFYLRIWDIVNEDSPYPSLSYMTEYPVEIPSNSIIYNSDALYSMDFGGYGRLRILNSRGEGDIRINIHSVNRGESIKPEIRNYENPGREYISALKEDRHGQYYNIDMTYDKATYKEYLFLKDDYELLQETKLDETILAADVNLGFDHWIFLTNKGLIERKVISKEEGLIKKAFVEANGLLEAGFHKQWLEKIKEAMKINPASKYFQSSFYTSIAAKGFKIKDIGGLLIYNYQLLRSEEKTNIVKQQIVLRLLEYGLFAERAGQRALVRQAAQAADNLSTENKFEDYQFTLHKASQLLESIYLVTGENPDRAYDYLLENKVFAEENAAKSKISFLKHIQYLPGLWQSLFIDRKKLSYLTGIAESQLQNIKYKKAEMSPYPDLKGNVIEAVGGSKNAESQVDNSKEQDGSGSVGTVLD